MRESRKDDDKKVTEKDKDRGGNKEEREFRVSEGLTP